MFPRRNQDQDAERNFRAFLSPSANKLIEAISDPVLEKAIELRALYSGLKTPDAIHIATGILTHCDLFVTADQAWAKVGIKVLDPADIR